LEGLGLDGEAVSDAVRSRSESRSRSRPSRSVSTSRVGRKRTREELERSMTPKPGEGFRNVKQKVDAQKMARREQREWARDGRRSEADRLIYDLKPKHLFSGKSGIGKKDYR
jgi:nucleolar GTP-binding protein